MEKTTHKPLFVILFVCSFTLLGLASFLLSRNAQTSRNTNSEPPLHER